MYGHFQFTDCKEAISLKIGRIDISDFNVGNKHQGLNFISIALLNGFLSCSREAHLLSHVTYNDKKCMLVSWIFDKLCEECSSSHQYHAFQMLLQWYERVGTLLGKTDIVQWLKNAEVKEQTVQLVWTHLDSPVDGVNEFVVDIFRNFLKLRHDINCCACLVKDGKNTSTVVDISVNHFMLVEPFINNLSSMSWTVKGKHKLLAVLLDYADAKQVRIDFCKIKLLSLISLKIKFGFIPKSLCYLYSIAIGYM